MKTTDLLTLTTEQRRAMMPAAKAFVLATMKGAKTTLFATGGCFFAFVVLYFTGEADLAGAMGGMTVLSACAAYWLQGKKKEAIRLWLLICSCDNCEKHRDKVRAAIAKSEGK